jgi:hypothetical protein
MVERTKACMVVLIGTLALSACASSQEPEGLMGNTNWLKQCNADDDCSDELSCRCGVCTRECQSSSDCEGLADAVCDSDSTALSMVCGSVAPSLCLPECSGGGSCGSGYECIDSRCLPAPDDVEDVELPSDVELGSQACGPYGAYAA